MAEPRAMNKKSFYGASESGQVPDIAMPPLDEVPPIAQAAPDPWSNQQQNQAFSVPDQLPQDTLEAMQPEEQAAPEEVEQEEASAPSEPRKPNESFREIRQAKEKAEQERDLLLRRMYEMEQALQMQQQVQQPQQQEPADADFDIDAGDNDLVEGKSLKKVAARIKKLEQQLKQSESQNRMSASEARLRAQYPDLDKVVSRENIETLRELHPDIARTLAASQDLYDQGAAAYKIIKNLGIYKDAVLEQDHARALNNTKKPRPLTSVSPQQGDSPLSKANAFANGLTDDLKEQLRREMYAARKAL